MRLSTIFPHLKGLRLTTLTVVAGIVILHLRAAARTASCPLCQCRARQVRSAYTRTLADLPWGGMPVRLQVHTRRFRCANPECMQRVFAERFSHLTIPHARQTCMRRVALQAIGMALGGNAGVRLATSLGIVTSRPTLLRVVRATPIPLSDAPQYVGIDEWAWRRGDRYGTILVDLEAHRPVALLPERSAESAAAWLRSHPGIALVCQDRSQLYADAITAGAPEAVQVADRFHLLKNLGDALEHFLLHKSACRRAAAQALTEPTVASNVAPAPPDAIYLSRAAEDFRCVCATHGGGEPAATREICDGI